MALGANVIKLLSSRIAAQVIGFATAPISARLFSPDDFGIRQIFVSIAGVIAVITCLRYELSIPLGRNEKEVSASFTLSLFFTLIFTLVVLAVVPVLKGKIAQWFKAPELKIFLGLLPIAVFIGGLGSSLRYWAAREGRFGAMAWSDFSSALGSRLAPIAWAVIIGASAAGLFAGYFAGAVVGILVLLIFLSRKLVSDIKNAHLNFEMLWTVAKRHKKFPIFSTWSGLLNTLSRELPTMVLGLYFSTTVVGYYSLGYRLVSLPMGLLGGSISQVFFPVAAKEYNEKGTLSQIVSNMFRRLVQIGVFPLVVLGFLGSILFGFVFGEKWIEAGVYSQILAAWLLFFFINSPLSSVFAILNRQGTNLFLNILTIFGRVAGLLVGGIIFGSPRWALGIFAAFSVFIIIGRLIWIMKLSNVSALWASKTILKYMALSCIILLPVKFISWIVEDSIIVLATTILATAFYIVVLLRIEPSFKQFILTIPSKFRNSKMDKPLEKDL